MWRSLNQFTAGCGGAGPGTRPGPARRVGPVACNIRAATRCCCVRVCEVILDLGDRARALEQLGVHPAVHSQMVLSVMDILPERKADLLVDSHRWSLPAVRVPNIRESDSTHTVARHLNRLTAGTSWKRAAGTALVGRLVYATFHALTTPLTVRPVPASRLWVSLMAACSRSTTTPPGPQTDTIAAAAASARAAGSQCRQDGRTRSSSVRSTGVPSTGAGSSAVGSIPPAAVLSSVARPSGPTVPNTV